MANTPVTYLGEVYDRDKDEARALIRRELHRSGGSVEKAAAALNVSRNFLYYLVGRLGMDAEPLEIRRQRAQRFRLPDVGKPADE